MYHDFLSGQKLAEKQVYHNTDEIMIQELERERLDKKYECINSVRRYNKRHPSSVTR